MSIFIRSLLLLLAVWQPASQAADSGWLRSAQNGHAEVRLRSATHNEDVQLLLDIRLQPGWKTYWRTPGEGGAAPVIRWQSDVTSEHWSWPVPARFDVSGLTTQGYHGNISLPITLRAAGMLRGTLTLSTCSNVCILTDYPFSLDLAEPADAEFATDFARAMGQVPVKAGLTDTLQAGYENGQLSLIANRADGWQQPEIFFDNPSGAMLGKPEIETKGRQMIARVPVTNEWGEAPPDLRGKKLSLVIADSGIAQQSSTGIGEAVAEYSGKSGLGYIALAAVLGGLILNLMPCVLPVLAMKLSVLVQAQGQSRRLTRQQFFASSAGIIASFGALALFMSILRLSGEVLGWGIQFQSSGFLLLMALVTFLFTASLFDLLHIRLPSTLSTTLATQGGNGLSGHFLQGAFATLLATPCTAPFLGTAIGWALTASLPVLWLLFLLMGVGMSLPWLILALKPGLARYLPRPGRWMQRLRSLLGLMLLLSCLWLLSLLSSHWGITVVAIIISLLMVTLTVCLIRKGERGLAASVLVVTVLSVAGYVMSVNNPVTAKGLRWQPLSEEAIQQALRDNKRVLVDVTADWCITCKVNKKRVLDDETVRQALSAEDVVLLRGDWSQADPEISAFLQRRGSAAVPFNQIYGPALPQGQVLAPLLSRDALLSVLSRSKENP